MRYVTIGRVPLSAAAVRRRLSMRWSPYNATAPPDQTELIAIAVVVLRRPGGI
jgi:hypothetical protein